MYKTIESLRQESSSEEESSNSDDGTGNTNYACKDFGIVEEAWDAEDDLWEDCIIDQEDCIKDPDWKANMEDDETDSSNDDDEIPDNTSQDARYVFCFFHHLQTFRKNK